MRVFLLVTLGWLYVPLQASATLSWTPNLQHAYDSLLALKLARGRELIDLERQTNPNNHLVEYLEDYADFITLLITENRSEYKVLERREAARLKILESEPTNTPWQRFARSEVLLHWALLRIKFDKSAMSAFFSIRTSYKLLQANVKAYPEFIPNGKTLGMMQVIIGTTPSGYKWLLGLLGFSATVPQGMGNLLLASSVSSPQSLEANLFRANCFTYVLKQPAVGTAILDSLYQSKPQHLVLGFFLSAALMKDGQSDSAFSILKALPKSYPYMPMFLISYQMGNILMYQGRFGEAIRYYHHFLTYYQGESNIADSWYKMYLAATLLGQKERANNYRSKCLSVDELVTEADKNAHSQLKKQQVLEPSLMTARLYNDGGYHQQALNYLKPIGLDAYTTPEYKAEYQYRLGRIYTGLRQEDSAAYYYGQSLDLSGQSSFPFTAKAALELGYYYSKKQDWVRAKQYLERAINVPSHAYSEGIERNAKAALAEVEKHL